MMRVLLIHNRYLQPGGEDRVFTAETSLLRRYGHEIVEYVEDNSRIDGMSGVKVASQTLWSMESYKRILGILLKTRPDVAHFHNTFLLISPSAYYACKKAGVPVVQTLHNYRLLCPTATFYRDGYVCEDCLGKTLPWPGVAHGCWRGSRGKTAVVACMLTLHRVLGTWKDRVDAYIALTEFSRQKFIRGGLPAERIFVKPNFIMSDELRVMGKGTHYSSLITGHFALFVGRLSPEKGIKTLLYAWKGLKGIPLKIVGDGPLLNEVKAFVEREGLKSVEVLGRLSREEVFTLMQKAYILVFPSELYEGFPMTIVEAFACGLPVVASRLGAMAELVEDGRTGLLFEPGNLEELAEKVEWAWTHPEEMEGMGREARREYEEKYTAERNYEILMEIYRRVMKKGEKVKRIKG